MANPLDCAVLKEALRKLIDDPNSIRKIRWWLKAAPSAERWFQFEFALCLEQSCCDEYAVACEIDRADIVVYKLPLVNLSLRENTPAFKMELKVNGNWYVSEDAFSGGSNSIDADVKKVDSYPLPSMALALWIEAKPCPDAREFQWIGEQVAAGYGKADMQEVEAKMGDRHFELAVQESLGACKDFEKLNVYLFIYRNSLARSSMKE